MKRPVLAFGLVSGAAATAFTLATLPFIRSHSLGTSDLLGYSSMVLTALLVFFGIRSYRDRDGGGRMSFGRGLAVGALIALVSSLVYAAAFEIIYFVVAPDFGDAFVACMIERAQSSGAAADQVSAAAAQAQTLKGLYDNPLANAVLSFAVTWPIGLIAAAVSAAFLRRRG